MAGTPVTDRVSDDELVRRTAGGDAPAFTALYRRRSADLFRFALHMTASATVAEDVTQDAFLVVMRDAGRFDPARASVMAWLCGIARNLVRQRLAQDRRLEPLDGEAEDQPAGTGRGTAGDEPDALGALIRAEQVEALRRAILTLPVSYREAVTLCDLQEFSYADAAAALECAVGTVRSRLHRGRALLAAKMTTAERPAAADGDGTPEGEHGVADGHLGRAEPRDQAFKPGGCFA